MSSNNSKIYEKIELILLVQENSLTTTKVEFVDSTITIAGNSLIINTSKIEGDTETTVSRVFELSELVGYKTYAKNEPKKELLK